MNKRRILGCMTGTSCDGLDLALLEVEGRGLELKAQFIRGQSFDLGDLGPLLRSFSEGAKLSAAEICELNRDFSELHVTSAQAFGTTVVDLYCIHGQTLYHAPPLSWQMIDLSWVAARLNCAVIGDLRGADLACGGQGAPITPLADAFFYGDPTESRCVINLGGFCNITELPAGSQRDKIRGYDLCAANQWLDFMAQKLLGMAYDANGDMALLGEIQPAWVKVWTQRLQGQYRAGHSLGQAEWPKQMWLMEGGLPADQLASACEALAMCIAQKIAETACDRVLVAGGGWQNIALRQALKRHIPKPVETCDAFGPSSEYREAAAMALLGVLSEDGVPITLPQVTGSQGVFCSGLRLDPVYSELV
jgi:anhydro-N-acetylmuramic acid kinase